MRASSSAQLLTVLARLRPGPDAHRRVPVLVFERSAASGPNGHGAEVELNPQPIPPGVQLRLAVQRTATAMADAAIAAQVAGYDAGEILRDAATTSRPLGKIHGRGAGHVSPPASDRARLARPRQCQAQAALFGRRRGSAEAPGGALAGNSTGSWAALEAPGPA